MKILPAPCFLCSLSGGYWVEIERAGQLATRRCDCARGKALSALDQKHAKRPATGVAMTRARPAKRDEQLLFGI